MLITDLFEDPDIMAVVRLGDVTVEVHRHLADQQLKRKVSNRRVEQVLRQIHMVPRRLDQSLCPNTCKGNPERSDCSRDRA